MLRRFGVMPDDGLRSRWFVFDTTAATKTKYVLRELCASKVVFEIALCGSRDFAFTLADHALEL
jgi:hypothetical protein